MKPPLTWSSLTFLQKKKLPRVQIQTVPLEVPIPIGVEEKRKRKAKKDAKSILVTRLPVPDVSSSKWSMQEKISDLEDQMKALNIHLAANKPEKKRLPITRSNVWCYTCSNPGHLPSECPVWVTSVQYAELEKWAEQEGSASYYLDEDFDNPVYQIQSS